MSDDPKSTPRSPLAVAEERVLASLLRPELEDLRAYVPHLPEGIEVKLDANEAPGPTLSVVRDVVARAVAAVAFERYPDPNALRLKAAIAARTGARADGLVVGSGSDELIALTQTALACPRGGNPQAVVLSPVPTFVMYRITARGHGLKPVEVPLDATWDLDVGMTKRAIDMMTPNIVFVASPNNPTGNRMTEARLREIVQHARGSFVIVDEAYIDYSGPDASLRKWRDEFVHLGLLRTVSKIGLAALRVGWLEAEPSLAIEIDKVRQPFNLSTTSQVAAAAVLEEAWDDVQSEVAKVVARREALAREIAAIDGFVVTPSAANFLWVKTPGSGKDVWERLIDDKILVRSFHASGGRLANQLRITLGTPAEHDRLLASLRRIRSQLG